MFEQTVETCSRARASDVLPLSAKACPSGPLPVHTTGRLYRMAEEGYVPPTSFAWIHLGLGEIDAAFEWLNRAVEECDQLLMPIKSYRFLNPIRSDPRFAALLRKMNLEA